MSNQVVSIKKIGNSGDIVRISIDEGVEEANTMPQLTQLIDSCFRKNLFKIILDMQRIKFPSASFIALLIEKTVQARRVGGDLKLINIAPSATNNLVTFSSVSFLATETDEAFAIEELNNLTVKTVTTMNWVEKEAPIQENPTPPTNTPAPKNTEKAVVNHPKQMPVAPRAVDSTETRFSIKEPNIQVNRIPTKSTPKKRPVKKMNHSPQPLPGAPTSVKKEIAHQKNRETAPARPSTMPTPPKAAPPSAPATNKPVTRRLRVKSKIESLYDICDFVTNLAERVGFTEKEVGKMKVTVYEASINVIEHAYHSDPDEWIVVTVQYNNTDFTIIIQDWGESFEFDHARQYDVNRAVHDRQTGGFGLFIIRRSMDDVKYKTDPINGNRLILMKKIPRK